MPIEQLQQASASRNAINPSPAGVNCSDITGTNSSSPAAARCQEANTALHAARVTRDKYPSVSADEYRKASTAARLAGDKDFELSILREAAAPTLANSVDPEVDENRREGGIYVRAGKAAEDNDPSCEGRLQAAADYLAAAEFYLRANDIDRADELLRKHDALDEEVDRRKLEGRCHSAPAAGPRTSSASPSIERMLPDQCKSALREFASWKQIVQNQVHGPDASKIISMIETKTVELAAKGCREPGAKEFDAGICLKAALVWSLHDGISMSERDARLKAAGCTVKTN